MSTANPLGNKIPLIQRVMHFGAKDPLCLEKFSAVTSIWMETVTDFPGTWIRIVDDPRSVKSALRYGSVKPFLDDNSENAKKYNELVKEVLSPHPVIPIDINAYPKRTCSMRRIP